MKINNKDFLEFLYERTFEILKTYGSKGWTMDDICKSCGISKDTLYRAVENKEELIIQALNSQIHRYILQMQDVLSANSDYYASFTKLVNILYETLEKFSSRQLQSVLQDYPLSSQYTKNQFHKLIEFVESFLQKGIDTNFLRNDLDVTFLAKNIHNNILYIIEKERPENYKHCISLYFDILLNGIK